MEQTKPIYVVEFVPVSGNWLQSDPEQRLKALLKAALRRYGMRCVRFQIITPGQGLPGLTSKIYVTNREN